MIMSTAFNFTTLEQLGGRTPTSIQKAQKARDAAHDRIATITTKASDTTALTGWVTTGNGNIDNIIREQAGYAWAVTAITTSDTAAVINANWQHAIRDAFPEIEAELARLFNQHAAATVNALQHLPQWPRVAEVAHTPGGSDNYGILLTATAAMNQIEKLRNSLAAHGYRTGTKNEDATTRYALWESWEQAARRNSGAPGHSPTIDPTIAPDQRMVPEIDGWVCIVRGGGQLRYVTVPEQQEHITRLNAAHDKANNTRNIDHRNRTQADIDAQAARTIQQARTRHINDPRQQAAAATFGIDLNND